MHRRVILILISLLLIAAASCTDGPDEPLDVTGGLGGDETNPTFDFGEEGTGLLTYRAELTALNDSGATGFAVIDATEQEVTVTIETMGIAPGVPHAQHLHIGVDTTCPSAANEEDLVTYEQVLDSAGVAAVSLTTEGDVGADSLLDLERYPVPLSDALGYSRSFDLPAPVIAEDLSEAVIVQHGMPAFSGEPDAYDGEERSSLDSDLPLEATVPVACGEFRAVDQER